MTTPDFTTQQLAFPWYTRDPFLFCVHHVDAYPRGNSQLGPESSLSGRDLGQDFAGKEGWSMYHGQQVPGFPRHPHRGFETVTVARRGFIDHSDSMGAQARFGEGDVQWMTAGRGIEHSEMFPLLKQDADNPLELFQIWLNLPAADKMVESHFAMLWSDAIPVCRMADDAGIETEVVVVCGEIEDARSPAATPESWAAKPEHHVAIWSLRIPPGGRFKLPAAADENINRTLYFFAGNTLEVGGRAVERGCAIEFETAGAVLLHNGDTETELLMLQGKPIGEPVAHYGPFVMNSHQEIRQAMQDYQTTRFGKWPWQDDEPTHSKEQGRFARHADGRIEEPNKV